MRLILKIFICFFIIILSGCAITHKYGPFSGKVVDAETGEPIEGAAVHISLFSQTIGIAGFGGGGDNYEGSVECLTDQNGEFKLSYRATTFKVFTFWDSQPRINIFKPGYGVFPGHPGTSITPRPERCCIEESLFGIIRLPKLKSKKERIRNLGHIKADAPDEEIKVFRTVTNQERIYLGFEPDKIFDSEKDN